MDFTDRAAASVAPIPIGGTFDLTDALDPNVYAAEKRQFLVETEALRGELAEQERERVLARARLRLRGRLEGILADAALSPVQKRAAIFELWDDCAEDATGGEAQQLVETFVRERMPRGSSLGYGEQELAALNLSRVSARPFRPVRKAGRRGRITPALAAQSAGFEILGCAASLPAPCAPA